VRHQGRIRGRRELDQPHTVGVALQGVPSHFQSKPGLPATAYPRQRQHPSISQAPRDLVQLALTADEARD
jgi:hypothetical protein